METIVNVVTLCFILSFFALMGLVIKSQFASDEKPADKTVSDKDVSEFLASVEKARK